MQLPEPWRFPWWQKDPNFSPTSSWVSLLPSASVLNFSFYYFHSLPWGHSPHSNPDTNTYNRCTTYHCGPEPATGKGTFLSKGQRLSGEALWNKGTAAQMLALRGRGGEATAGEIRGLPSSIPEKGTKIRDGSEIFTTILWRRRVCNYHTHFSIEDT